MHAATSSVAQQSTLTEAHSKYPNNHTRRRSLLHMYNDYLKPLDTYIIRVRSSSRRENVELAPFFKAKCRDGLFSYEVAVNELRI